MPELEISQIEIKHAYNDTINTFLLKLKSKINQDLLEVLKLTDLNVKKKSEILHEYLSEVTRPEKYDMS